MVSAWATTAFEIFGVIIIGCVAVLLIVLTVVAVMAILDSIKD